MLCYAMPCPAPSCPALPCPALPCEGVELPTYLPTYLPTCAAYLTYLANLPYLKKQRGTVVRRSDYVVPSTHVYPCCDSGEREREREREEKEIRSPQFRYLTYLTFGR